MGWTFPPSAVRMADLGGWHTGTTAPAPHEGMVWLDTSSQMAPVLKVWLAGAWRTLSGGAAPDVGLLADLAQAAPMPIQSLAGYVEGSAPGLVYAMLTQTAPAPTQTASGQIGTPSGGSWFTDFSGDTTGAAPSGWTVRWDVGTTTWAVREKLGTTGGKCLEFTGGTSGWRHLSFDPPGQVASADAVEVVARLRTSSVSGNRIVPVARTDDSSVTSYTIRLNSGVAQAYRYLNGSGTLLGPSLGTASNGVWYWMRLRVEGANVKTRFWIDGDPEPSTWGTDETDSSPIVSAGRVGVALWSTTGTQDCDLFGVAVGGGTAPTSH
jgi:hypothetical protein